MTFFLSYAEVLERRNARSAAELEARDTGLREIVLAEYAKVGATGLAPDECAERLGLARQTARATTSALKLEGLLVRTGERRATGVGGKAYVLAVASALVH